MKTQIYHFCIVCTLLGERQETIHLVQCERKTKTSFQYICTYSVFSSVEQNTLQTTLEQPHEMMRSQSWTVNIRSDLPVSVRINTLTLLGTS